MSDTPPHHINLLDFLAFLVRWRKFLLTLVLGVTVLTAILAFVLKPSYRSMAVIAPNDQQQGNYGGFIASKLSMFGGIPGMGSLLGSTSTDILIQILRSRWMSERLITAFDLEKVYGMKGAPMEQIIEVMKAHVRYEKDPISASVLIYAMDTDPKRSQAMAQFMVDELDKRNQELRSTSARREREFIGQRLEEARQAAKIAEDSLTQFQLATGVLNIGEQIKATLQAAATVEAQRLAVQTELEMNQRIFSPQNPEVSMLRLKIASLDSTLYSLTRTKGSKSADILMRLQDSPREVAAFYRLTRDIEAQQLLVAYFLQQYEQAKIEEQRDTPTIMRIDPPVIATSRAWPKRGMMTAIAAAASLIFGVAFALAYDFFHNAAADPMHPQHQRMLAIRRAWHTERV